MKLERHSEAEVRVSFEVGKRGILYPFCITSRPILEPWGSKFWSCRVPTANLEAVLVS